MATSPSPSPAEAFSAARRRSSYPKLTEFIAALPFELDPFQDQACAALEDGHGVLVCAPTGAGKTVVGEFAVHLALGEGRKCFYTTPIKALSNQKYADLVERYGAKSVGLLTGDTSVNGSAPIVVMTTEVLRNMLYAGSSTLDGLGYVVMDEVHYLADRFRGAVWEEVILHLPDWVRLVSLSATVSNAEEFGDWLVEVRGDTTVVVDEHRPVPLWQHMMVGGSMLDLFAGEGPDGEARINPELLRRAEDTGRHAWGPRNRDRGGRRGGPPPRGGARFRPPSRVDVVSRLDGAGLLPAIVFVFSRIGCEAAVAQCTRSGLRMNTEAEVAEIRRIVDAKTKDLADADLRVLGYWEWREALERGFASHHAGLLPAFKETVEELFLRGLVKVVFATETLALGINMPARTVVLERLVKYNGEAHVELTPGEYTQLTGRAGRRGIDIEGHAVVVWQPGIDPKQVGGLASTRTYPLRSSFRPAYNMAVNLVDRLGAQQARELLEQSFAQFQADRAVVGTARRIERNREALAGYADSMTCHLGDFTEYAALRAKLNEREKTLSRKNANARRAEAARSLESLRRGDVIAVPTGRRSGLAIVVDPGVDPMGDPRPLVVTEDRWAGRLSVADFPSPVEALGRVKLPKQVDLRSPKSRRDLASTLRNTGIEAPDRNRRRRSGADEDGELAALRRALRAHPCHGCDDREAHARWAERHRRLSAETRQLEERVAATTHSLARGFDRICALLTERGYLAKAVSESEGADGVWTEERRRRASAEHATREDAVLATERSEQSTTADGEMAVSDDGRRLARLYSESDLLAAECLRQHVWDGLEPAELAAVVSALVYEARRDGPTEARVPAGPVTDTLAEVARIWASLEADERRHKLERTRQPDAGFAWTVYRWARGESLERVMTAAESAGAEFSAGDFVRWCRQVIDLLDQLRDVLGRGDPVGAAAQAAVKAMRRGVVALGTA